MTDPTPILTGRFIARPGRHDLTIARRAFPDAEFLTVAWDEIDEVLDLLMRAAGGARR